jgi:hypothetical protein
MVLMNEESGEPIEGGYLPLKVFAQAAIDIEELIALPEPVRETQGTLEAYSETLGGYFTVGASSRVLVKAEAFEKSGMVPTIGRIYRFRVITEGAGPYADELELIE